MSEDIVERLRDGWDLDDADRIEAAAELERSRDEIKRLQVKAARADELQAVIDAWAAAADWSWVPGDPTNALAAAEDALLAAATKGDDRG